VLATSPVPCLLGLPHTLTMLCQGSVVSGRVPPVVPVGPQPYFPEQRTGVIRQLHDPHAHPVPRAARAMSALGVSAGQPAATARPPATARPAVRVQRGGKGASVAMSWSVRPMPWRRGMVS